jgi:CubicO group peptidase (beta-lactamase class C family)
MRPDPASLQRALDTLYAPDAPHGVSLATVVMHHGDIVAERYGVQPDTPFGPGHPITPDSTLISWSMAKSITHAAVGILVGERRLHLDAPASVPAWQGTPKEAITLQHLLEMRSGLLFVEDYVDDGVSHCLEMLFGAASGDAATYAAALPLVTEPGSTFNYSSGTTNIVTRIIGDTVGGGREGMETFLRDRLFTPAGMHSAIPKFDDAGTWIGSSYVFAAARDFARFGELYRNDGATPDGRQVVPPGWRDHARTWSAHDEQFDYGAHWWLWREYPGAFGAHGYEGQYTVVVPSRSLVLVHLGKSPIEQRPILNTMLRAVIDCFEDGS